MLFRENYPVCDGTKTHSERASVGPISKRPIVVGICYTCNKWVFVEDCKPDWHTIDGHPLAKTSK